MIDLRKRPWLGMVPMAYRPSLGAAPSDITDATFNQILAAPKAVVKFYSPGCPYSRKFAPIYEAVAPQYPDVFFASVNVDQDVQQAGVNKVQMLPTVVFFVNGKAVGRIDGVQDQGDFLQEMGKAFSGAPAAPQPSPAPAAPQEASVSPRSGTLVDMPQPASPVPYVLGGAAAVVALGTAAYFLFLAK